MSKYIVLGPSRVRIHGVAGGDVGDEIELTDGQAKVHLEAGEIEEVGAHKARMKAEAKAAQEAEIEEAKAVLERTKDRQARAGKRAERAAAKEAAKSSEETAPPRDTTPAEAPKWTRKMKPETYLKRYPEGPDAALAKAVLGQ